MKCGLEPPQAPVPTFHRLTTAQLLLIDRACVEFEGALRRQRPPAIETLLSGVEKQLQACLFRELLYQEIAYKQRHRERVDRRAYLHRFPQFARQIAEVCALLSADEEAATATEAGARGSAFAARGGLEIPGYRIKSRLARGGMGVVYHAHDEKLDREVAIKMLASDQMVTEQMVRLQKEAQVISALQHPNIIQIHTVDEHHGQPYLVLEYAGGGTLQDRLRGGPLSTAETLSCMITVVKALCFVHQQGFLHRDLKPSNILFNRLGVLKITDFGLAKDLADAGLLTQTKIQMGTPAYMAPEQVDPNAGKVGETTDIYALGLLMHAMLSGFSPYEHLASAQIAAALASGVPTSRKHLVAGKVPEAFTRVCLRCLEKRPQHRYPSAQALLDDLMRLQQGLAVSASASYRSRRIKGMAAVAAALLAAAGSLFALRSDIPVNATPRSGFLGSEITGRLAAPTLAALGRPYNGERDFELLTLLAPTLPEQAGGLLNSPQSLAVYRDRYLAIADTLNHRVLSIDLHSGHISRVAGSGRPSYSGDGAAAANAGLNQPAGLAFDPAGQLYIADRANHAVRRVDSNGIIATVSGGTGCESEARHSSISTLCYPGDVSVVADDNYFVADTLRQRIRHLQQPRVRKTATTVYQYQPLQPPVFAPLPQAIAHHRNLLYFTNNANGNIYRRDASGNSLLLASGFVNPSDLAVDSKGHVYVADRAADTIARIDPVTMQSEVLSRAALRDHAATGAPIQSVAAITIDGRDRVFLADDTTNSISLILPNSRQPQLPMQRRSGGATAAVHTAYPAERLAQHMSFSYVGASGYEVFTDIAYKLGVHPVLQHSVDMESDIFIEGEGLTAREMLLVICTLRSVNCGISRSTLIVGAPGFYRSLTAAQPLGIENPLTFIGNHQYIPDHLVAEAQRNISLASGSHSNVEQFFAQLDALSDYDYQLDSSMDSYREVQFDLSGDFRLGDIHAALVLWRRINLTYDPQTARLVVSAWEKLQQAPQPRS